MLISLQSHKHLNFRLLRPEQRKYLHSLSTVTQLVDSLSFHLSPFFLVRLISHQTQHWKLLKGQTCFRLKYCKLVSLISFTSSSPLCQNRISTISSSKEIYHHRNQVALHMNVWKVANLEGLESTLILLWIILRQYKHAGIFVQIELWSEVVKESTFLVSNPVQA